VARVAATVAPVEDGEGLGAAAEAEMAEVELVEETVGVGEEVEL
jgi:hypothetical protein